MARVEVKSVKLLGTPVEYAYAVNAGKWIFLTGHEAFDFESGVPEAVAGPPGFPLYGRSRSRREGDFILQRMQRILREFGSDLAHAVRLDQYYPNPEAVAAYHLARHAAFADYIPPSTSVVLERCFAAETTISTSLIAVTSGAGHEIRKIHPPGVASAPTSGFVPAVVCDDFVFVAGQMAHNPGQGLDPIEDLPDFLDVWNGYYAKIPCALTVVPTKSFATIGGIIEINLIALTDTAQREKEVIAADVPEMAAFGPCIRAGEFLLPSGLMAIGRDGHIAGKSVSPGFAGLSHAGYVQAAAVYDYAEALCRAAGTSMANVVRAQYFVPDVTAFAGITMAWAAKFGAQPHPFVCVQTPPAMPVPGAALTADFWIHAG